MPSGRPPKEPTADERAKVAELLALKVAIEDLVKMCGVSKPTFRKYFHNEIRLAKNIRADGRPAREVTAAHRHKVSLYLGYGLAPEEIALALGYVDEGDYAEFRASFAFELKVKRTDRGGVIANFPRGKCTKVRICSVCNSTFFPRHGFLNACSDECRNVYKRIVQSIYGKMRNYDDRQKLSDYYIAKLLGLKIEEAKPLIPVKRAQMEIKRELARRS